MHRKATFLILSFLLALLSTDFASAQTLKIPYVSISGFQAPLYLGERAGLFKKNQLEAQLIYMPGGSLIVQTLLSGDVGVASLAPPSAVAAWVKGAELARGRRRHRARAQCADGQSKDQKARRSEGQASGDQPFRLAVGCLAARRSGILQTASESGRAGRANGRPRRAHGGAHVGRRRRRNI